MSERPELDDPLSGLVGRLRPRAVLARAISGAGAWAVRYGRFGNPSFCTVLTGSCRLAVDGHAPLTLRAGDFVLMPATPGFTISSFEPATPVTADPAYAAQSTTPLRHGAANAPADVEMQGGWFEFDSPDPTLIDCLLPSLVHLHGAERLALLARMVAEEVGDERPGRELALARLVDLLLVEALRGLDRPDAAPGLVRGLADARIAPALRAMHAEPAQRWTIAQLAGVAALSRSAFFDRFVQVIGVPPMDYLLAWRMAIAKELLHRGGVALDVVAERVGYGSASAFSTAFTRRVGCSPSRFSRGAYHKES